MKKILLLGGSAQQIIAIETAKRLGYYTVPNKLSYGKSGQTFMLFVTSPKTFLPSPCFRYDKGNAEKTET